MSAHTPGITPDYLVERRKLYDAKGLYLVLRPDGSRWWRLKYRRPVTGKEIEAAIAAAGGPAANA